MSLMSITILNQNGRRKTVKVQPSDIIMKALEEFCQREDLDSTLHEFIFQRKILNPSQTWKSANVPNNAKLELEEQSSPRVEKPVKIALQMQGVKRMQNVFVPSTSLREILCYFENQYAAEVKPGIAIGILYLRKEFFGLALNETLKSLGLTSGSALLKTITKPQSEVNALDERYQKKLDAITKKANKLKKEAIAAPKDVDLQSVAQPTTVPQPLPQKSMSFEDRDHEILNRSIATESRVQQSDSDETVRKKFKHRSPSPSSPEPEMAMSFENFKFPAETEGMDLQISVENLTEEFAALSQPCDRDAVFYDETKRITTNDNIEELGDEFYEVTIDDLRIMLSELKHIQQDLENKPLKTSRSKEMERLKAMQRYPLIMIRIVFPEQLVLQGMFRPGEKAHNLYNFVADALDNRYKNQFYLYTSPPKFILKDREKVLFDYKLSPASKVYCNLQNEEFSMNCFRKETLANIMTPADANQKLGTIYNNYNNSNTDKAQEQYADIPSTSSAQIGTRPQPSNSNTKAPKWFKLGKR